MWDPCLLPSVLLGQTICWWGRKAKLYTMGANLAAHLCAIVHPLGWFCFCADLLQLTYTAQL
jgi:hypothetical protein